MFAKVIEIDYLDEPGYSHRPSKAEEKRRAGTPGLMVESDRAASERPQSSRSGDQRSSVRSRSSFGSDNDERS